MRAGLSWVIELAGAVVEADVDLVAFHLLNIFLDRVAGKQRADRAEHQSWTSGRRPAGLAAESRRRLHLRLAPKTGAFALFLVSRTDLESTPRNR